jgi:hypothetical protein
MMAPAAEPRMRRLRRLEVTRQAVGRSSCSRY